MNTDKQFDFPSVTALIDLAAKNPEVREGWNRFIELEYIRKGKRSLTNNELERASFCYLQTLFNIEQTKVSSDFHQPSSLNQPVTHKRNDMHSVNFHRPTVTFYIFLAVATTVLTALVCYQPKSDTTPTVTDQQIFNARLAEVRNNRVRK